MTRTRTESWRIDSAGGETGSKMDRSCAASGPMANNAEGFIPHLPLASSASSTKRSSSVGRKNQRPPEHLARRLVGAAVSEPEEVADHRAPRPHTAGIVYGKHTQTGVCILVTVNPGNRQEMRPLSEKDDQE